MRSYACTLAFTLALSACAHGTVMETLLESKDGTPSCDGGGSGGSVVPVSNGGAGGMAGSAGAAGSAGSAGDGGTGGDHTGGSGGSGPIGCDATGDCGTCGDCALNGGACNAEMNACSANQSCMDFYDCITPCVDQLCFDSCVSQNPQGEALYTNFVMCIVCGECPASCGGC